MRSLSGTKVAIDVAYPGMSLFRTVKGLPGGFLLFEYYLSLNDLILEC